MACASVSAAWDFSVNLLKSINVHQSTISDRVHDKLRLFIGQWQPAHHYATSSILTNRMRSFGCLVPKTIIMAQRQPIFFGRLAKLRVGWRRANREVSRHPRRRRER